MTRLEVLTIHALYVAMLEEDRSTSVSSPEAILLAEVRKVRGDVDGVVYSAGADFTGGPIHPTIIGTGISISISHFQR